MSGRGFRSFRTLEVEELVRTIRTEADEGHACLLLIDMLHRVYREGILRGIAGAQEAAGNDQS